MDAGEDFAHAEGFGDVVVGAEFESDDGVDFFGFGGEKEERNLRVVTANSFADFVTVEFGHHDVETDEIWTF